MYRSATEAVHGEVELLLHASVNSLTGTLQVIVDRITRDCNSIALAKKSHQNAESLPAHELRLRKQIRKMVEDADRPIMQALKREQKGKRFRKSSGAQKKETKEET